MSKARLVRGILVWGLALAVIVGSGISLYAAGTVNHAGAGTDSSSASASPAQALSQVPGTTSLKGLRLDVVGVRFLTQLTGDNADFNQTDDLDKYRGAVVTLKVTKPAGTELTLHAADLPIHYWRGQREAYDVLPCHGMSSFSTDANADRAMSLYAGSWGKQATEAGTTAAPVIYVDLFYELIEPDISRIYILFARQIGNGLKTAGWTPEGGVG